MKSKYVLIILNLSLSSAFLNSAFASQSFPKPFNDLIVGGQSVAADDPIANSVVALYQPDGNGAALCSATLISRKFALTAAHCVDGGTDGMMAIFAQDIRSSTAVSLPVIAAVVSPNWRQNPSSDSDQGDIAVIELEGKLPQGYRSVPILPKKTKLEVDQEVTLAGFGVSNADKQDGEGILRKADVKIAQPDFGDTEIIFDQTQGTGACHGDSGGPAFMRKNGKLYLLGVTNRAYPDSAPDDCAHQVVYTKAGAYKGWISETMKSLKTSETTDQQ